MAPPTAIAWLFWDVDPASIECDRDEGYILPRVLESGGMAEVRWAIATYGRDRIHRFLRDVGHPELSPRTLTFWRAVFKAEAETWATSPDWRRSNCAPWPH